MTRLFFNLRCDDYCNGYRSSLPHVLSLHRPLQRDLLGKTRLSEDGTVILCGDFVFYVCEAYFASVGSWSDTDKVSTPKLVLDTDIDPLLGNICSKYSDVVKLRSASILGDAVRGSIELMCNDAQGLRGVFAFIGEMLRLGVGKFDGASVGVPSSTRDLCYGVAHACNDFLKAYFFCYVQRAASSMYLKGGYGGEWAIDTEFFIRSAQGRVLLYDEVTSGVLSLLYEYARVIPFMKEEGNKALVHAALNSINSLGDGLKNDIADDQVAIDYSLENACVASVMGSCVSDIAISDHSTKLVKGLLFIEEGFPRAFNEALEIIAMVVAFSPSTDQSPLLSQEALRLLSVRSSFQDICDKHRRIADKLTFPVFASGSHISFLYKVLSDVYRGAVSSEDTGSAACYNTLEEEVGRVFVDVLLKYKKYSQMGVLRSFLGMEGSLSAGRFAHVSYAAPKKLFARFCLRELLLRFTAVSFEQNASMKSVNVNLGSHVVIDHKISRIYACDYGNIRIPALATEEAVVPYGDSRSTSSSDMVAHQMIDGLASFGSGNGKKGASTWIPVGVFVVSCIAAMLMGGVVLHYGAAMSAKTRVSCLLLVSAFITVALAAIAAFCFILAQRDKSSRCAELHLCFKTKEGAEWFDTACSSANPLVSFYGNKLHINGNCVSEDQYDISLIEGGSELPDGKCMLLGIASVRDEGMQLLRSIAQTGGGFSVSKNLFFSEKDSDTGYNFCSVRYTSELSSREDYLRLATVLARAGRTELLIAYLDAYVAVAFDEGSDSIKKEFLSSKKWQLLCQDQARWCVLDVVMNSCGEAFVGNRERFVECAVAAMKESRARKVGFLEFKWSGFPFDRENYSEFMRFVPGFDSDNSKFTESILFNWAGVSFARDRRCYVPEKAMEGESREHAMKAEVDSVSFWDVLCSAPMAGYTTDL